jgi:SAM-dependent methyltransferase
VLPSEFATAKTIEFLLRQLADRRRVLEVGCGNGQVAARLQSAGHQVVAIDSTADAIATAHGLGINARCATWPDFDDPLLFDAIAFTRSLHHVTALDEGVRRAGESLSPRGMVVIEDFAFDDIDEPTAGWFVGVLRELDLAEALSRDPGAFATRLVECSDGLALWRECHSVHIHAWSDILRAVGSAFDVVGTADEPYLYRYACEVLPRTDRGGTIAARLYTLERDLAQHGGGRLIGRRLVARKPSPP